MNTENTTSNAKKNRLPLILAIGLVLIAAVAGFLWYWNTPAEIAVSKAPDQTVYDYGSALNTQGLVLEVTYNSGKKEQITEGFTCAPMELMEAGDVDIEVTYKDLTASYSVQSIPVLTGIRVVNAPSLTRYLIGSQLDTAGLVVEADYNDGSVQTVTEAITCAPLELAAVGQQQITVSYEDKQTLFPVDVVEITDISVRRLDGRVYFMVGEAMDPAGYALNITYSDGEKETVRTGLSCSDAVFTEPGEQDAIIYYKDKELTVPVDVLPEVTFDHFEFELTSASYGDGSGYNSKGAYIYWTMLFTFDLDSQTRSVFEPLIFCSWDHVYNGEGVWEKECNFESAKKGETYAEFGIWEAQNSPNGKERFTLMLYLPDDPTIEGPQSVTLKVGNCEMTVNFELIYCGDYENSTGWRITNVTY